MHGAKAARQHPCHVVIVDVIDVRFPGHEAIDYSLGGVDAVDLEAALDGASGEGKSDVAQPDDREGLDRFAVDVTLPWNRHVDAAATAILSQ
jgi:hypothetical protein